MYLNNILILLVLTLLIFSSQACATPMNRSNAMKHAQIAVQASSMGDWDSSRREWAKAVVNADLGNLEAPQRAVFYYEYGRSAGVTCFFDIAEDYLNKSYELDAEIGGPSVLSLVELFRLNLDQKKYKEAVEYFKKALPELEKLNAPKESPAEFSKLLEEYAIALKVINNKEESKKIEARALKVRKSAKHSITDRTPYGSKCTNK